MKPKRQRIGKKSMIECKQKIKIFTVHFVDIFFRAQN